MGCFKNILAIYDDRAGSEAVLDQAVAVARAAGARLMLMKLLGPNDSMEIARTRLQRMVPWVAQQGVGNVATTVATGVPHQEIIRQVMHDEHDLVILSADCGHSLNNIIFGNVARRLMRSCPCPVWVLKPDQTMTCSRILAAVGEPAGDPAYDVVNARILELGTELARSQDAKLHVLHAWVPEGSDAALLTNEISDETRRGILQRNEAQRRCAVNALLARCPVVGLDHEIHLPRGLPQQEIVALVGRLNADVVVMGSSVRAGMPRILLGNPAETVLGTVGCSVITVKPGGFEVPVSALEQDDLPGSRLMAAGYR